MEVAFFVIAVLGLLALTSGGGTLSATVQPTQGVTSYSPPQPWSPAPTAAYQPPMVPSTAANIGTQPIMSGASAIGTTIQQQSASQNGGTPTVTASVIGAAVGIIGSIASSLLAAHEARLKGATNENQAVDQYIPVFDSFIQAIVQAYNSGQCTAAQAAQACQQFDQYIYQSFRRLVGAPGTAWSDQIGMAGQCNSSCTVGCCVYFGDLGPPLNDISFVLGFPTSKWGRGDPRISGRTVTIPKVYPSKYSSFTRPLYTVTLK